MKPDTLTLGSLALGALAGLGFDRIEVVLAFSLVAGVVWALACGKMEWL
jgi:hypothetical protein